MDPLLDLLHSRFGLKQFRGIQRSIIEAILEGRDTLGLMPTGQGKTLCYQVPALILPGITLVISPLTALMRDQAQRLDQLHIPVVSLLGELTPGEWRQKGEAIGKGAKIVLLSPERAIGERFNTWFDQSRRGRPISLLVIDEAHCVIEWGKSFRPSYLKLPSLRARYPEATWLLMTATADLLMRQGIAKSFSIPETAIQSMSFNRPEIFYQVDETTEPLISAVRYLKRYQPASPVIIYCRERSTTESVALRLKSLGFTAEAYHAGLPYAVRQSREAWFQGASVGVMVATIAFGMGMDKPDVRAVIHLGLPERLVHYIQETGRGGRDGRTADALLLYSVSRQDIASEGLSYARAKSCRRALLLGRLGERLTAPCRACDLCVPEERRMMEAPSRREAPWVRRSPLLRV